MRPLTTLALFITSVILGIVIWRTDRDPAEGESGGGRRDADKALIRLETATLTRMTIKRPDGEAILEKRDGYWHFTQPITDRADPEAMTGLLDLLGHLTVLDQIPIDEVGSRDELAPEALGLTSEKVVLVELSGPKDSGIADQAILLGSSTPLANSLYARIPESKDRPDVYVVNGNPRKYLDSPVEALRDRHLFLAPAEQIVQINVKTPKGEIEMKRKITPPLADWTLTKPLQTRADRERIGALIAGLAGLRVENVLSSGDLPGPPPNPVPDGSLALDIWRYGVNEPLKIYLSPGRDEAGDSSELGQPLPVIEVRVSDRPAVFQARSDLLAIIPSTTNSFRDPHLARIPLQSVFGIAIESRGNPPVVLKTARSQDGVRWFSERNGVQESANAAQIAELIQAINQEKVLNFVSDSTDQLAEFNLINPAVQVAISHYEILPETAPDGAPAGGGGKMGIVKKVLQLGYTESADPAKEAHKLYANFVGEPFIQEISAAFQEKVPTHPLKWKDLKILNFNPISLRGIERVMGGDEAAALKLVYDYRRDAWTGTEGAVDISERVNREAARKLRDTLGSLTANRWLTPSPQAFQAIENPDVILQVTLETVDRATGSTRNTTHQIRLAKATEASYYGRVDDSPDLFEIGRDTYRDLIVPLLMLKVGAPE